MKTIPLVVQKAAEQASKDIITSYCQSYAIEELASYGITVIGFHHTQRDTPIMDCEEVLLSTNCDPDSDEYISQLIEESKQAYSKLTGA